MESGMQILASEVLPRRKLAKLVQCLGDMQHSMIQLIVPMETTA